MEEKKHSLLGTALQPLVFCPEGRACCLSLTGNLDYRS